MDASRFDRLTHVISTVLTRRALTGAFGLATIGLPGSVAAKKKRKKKKVTFNDFGCVDVGKFCKNGGQCCSGICQGKKGKKKCKAHDTGGCPAGLTEKFCGAPAEEECTTSGGLAGVCDTTTGNAGYCLAGGGCAPCTKDADCRSICGPTAACIQCAACEETGGTLCATAGPGNCGFPV